MANIKAAQKHIRSSKKRTAANKVRKSELKTYIKKFDEAIEADNIEEAQRLFKLIDKKLKQATHKNILHKNSASRRLSHLNKKLNNAM